MSHGRDQTTKADSKKEIIHELHGILRPTRVPSDPTPDKLSFATSESIPIFLPIHIRQFSLFQTLNTYCRTLLGSRLVHGHFQTYFAPLLPPMPPILKPYLQPYLQPSIPPCLPPPL